jgi:hypothetical protein
MEASPGYLEQLTQALDETGRWLSSTGLPRFREAVASYQSLFEGTMAMLIRKGLLREDPYNYDQDFSEITVPADDPLPEFENSDEVSFRLAAFRRQLRYLGGEYKLELGFLTLARLKKVSALLSYVSWQDFGDRSKSPTTRAFARAFMKVRMGTDSLASQILKDSETQITRTMHELRDLLGRLIAWNRESWKAEVRAQVLPAISIAAGATRRDEILKGIRRYFPQRMAGRPWFPALAEEIADEETAPDGQARRDKVLAALATGDAPPASAAPAPVQQAEDGRAVLLDALRQLARPNEELATALAALEENEKTLASGARQDGGWLRRMLGSRPQKEQPRAYTVEYAEPGVATPRTERVDFNDFLAESGRTATLLASLASGTGPAWRKLQSGDEAALAAFVDETMHDLLVIHRRMGGLNTMFQARAAKDKRTVRGIRVELMTIKNAIAKAAQRRSDYRG